MGLDKLIGFIVSNPDLKKYYPSLREMCENIIKQSFIKTKKK